MVSTASGRNPLSAAIVTFQNGSRLAMPTCVCSSGELPAAIEWYERAAEAPAPTVEAGRELLFELAQTLEASGEEARALAVYLELRTDAGDYRDISSRIERLSRGQSGR